MEVVIIGSVGIAYDGTTFYVRWVGPNAIPKRHKREQPVVVRKVYV